MKTSNDNAPRMSEPREMAVRLRREMFHDLEAVSAEDAAFRRGWNARARSILVDLLFDVSDIEVPT